MSSDSETNSSDEDYILTDMLDTENAAKSTASPLGPQALTPPNVRGDVTVAFSEDAKHSTEELLDEVRKLRSHIHVLTCTVQSLYAQLSASNAHCTITKRGWEDTWACLENAQKKQKTVRKVKDRP
ncbi:hypothetical protein BDQ17DRAFT_1436325 [Cyathus striatus]|nr:hypothetical protein BDQ17DRAFT_1436325 [Cyathus striatus]